MEQWGQKVGKAAAKGIGSMVFACHLSSSSRVVTEGHEISPDVYPTYIDFLARVILHVVQGIGPLRFSESSPSKPARHDHCRAELSYWYIIMGYQMAHIVTLLPLHLEHMVRCFRLLRFSWVICTLRLAFKYVRLIIDIVLNILRLIFDKVLCAALPPEEKKERRTSGSGTNKDAARKNQKSKRTTSK